MIIGVVLKPKKETDMSEEKEIKCCTNNLGEYGLDAREQRINELLQRIDRINEDRIKFMEIFSDNINTPSHFSKVQYEKKIKDLEQKLANEIKERTQLQKDFDNIVNECERLENLPKVGDTCIFWEKNCKEVTVGVLKEIRTDKHFPYLSENENDYTDCIKYSLENLESKIKELFNE